MGTSSGSIVFAGLVRDRLGIALWQADGTGPEPAAIGHSFVTPLETITAHYYVASRDYVDLSARGGLVATELNGEWSRLRAALTHVRKQLADFIIRLPLTTAGPDREGEDWFYKEGVETRFLRPQAPMPLSLQSYAFVEFEPPRLVLTEDYRNARSFEDVKISISSDPTPAKVVGSVTDGPYASVAEAFLADLGGRAVRFVVESIRLTPTTFSGSGRTSGRLAEIPVARLEVI